MHKNTTRFFLAAWLFAAIAFLTLPLFVGSAHAQAAAPAAVSDGTNSVVTATPVNGIDVTNIVTWLTPLLVPLLIAAKKKVWPSIPGWCLPMIAPLLGIALDYINSLATSHQHNFVLAALLGLAGVGVREVKDQIVPSAPAPV